jgi:hypothetical protein
MLPHHATAPQSPRRFGVGLEVMFQVGTSFADRRFYRRKYDAARVLAAFGATARDATDLEQLTAEMLRVVDETVQPEFVGLWLREPERGG